MKKDLLIYLANVVAAVCVIAIIINTAPGYASQIGTISSGVAAVFSPQINMEKITEKTTAKTEKSDNTNNTAAISASRSTDGIKGKDSDLYSDITKIPDDIAKLMSDAEKKTTFLDVELVLFGVS